jgi:hypothetical protein
MGTRLRPAVLAALVLAFLGAGSPVRSQGPGELKWIPLEDLLSGGAPLTTGVRTRGTLEVGPRTPGMMRGYFLAPSFDSKVATVQRRLRIYPVGMAATTFDSDADLLHMRVIEVMGSFQAPQGMSTTGSGQVLWFWSYVEQRETESSRVRKPGEMAIEDLAGRPESLAKQSVKVLGQFRGRNLFGDLDAARAPRDGWVIKDGDHAVWVVGKKPKGNGWSLDPESRGDTTKWIEVTGKVERTGGLLLLRAQHVALVAPPAPSDDNE